MPSCPACPRKSIKLTVNEDDSTLSCPCHLNVTLEQVSVNEGDKKVASLVIPSSSIDSDFIHVRPHPNLIRAGYSPEVMKYVGDDEVQVDFVVLYRNSFANSNLHCPRCGAYLGTMEIISGSHISRPCNQNLRIKHDGVNGKCKTRTKYIWRSDSVGPGVLSTGYGRG